MFTRTSGFFAKSHINYNKTNYQQRGGNLPISHYLIEIHSSSKYSSAETAEYQVNIANNKSLVNKNLSGVVKAATSQITARFEHIVENTLNCARLVSKEKFINVHIIRKMEISQYV